MANGDKPKSGSILIKSQWFQNVVAVASTLAIIGGCGAYLRRDMVAWGDRMLDRVMENTSHKIEIHEAIPAHAGMDSRAGRIEASMDATENTVQRNTGLIMENTFEIKQLQKDQKEGFKRMGEQLDKIEDKLPN